MAVPNGSSSTSVTGGNSTHSSSGAPNSLLDNPFCAISSDFANSYELAYHHHLQTALQMGQFYSPSDLTAHHSSAAAAAAAAAAMALRSPGQNSGHGMSTHSSSSAGVSGSGVGSSGGNMNTNILSSNSHSSSGLGAVASVGLWGDGGHRGPQLGYHHHQGPDLIPLTTGISCDIWSAANGRSGGTVGQRYGPNKTSSKKPRRRVATIAQRRAANIRERRRMFNLNEAFDRLRRKVPTFAYEKRLSRIETLRLAITYISFMTDILLVPEGHGKTMERSSKGSHGNHQNSHSNNLNYGLNNSSSSVNNGNSTATLLGASDCHQNQNIPPPQFPLGRIYSSHHSGPTSAPSYLSSNMHH